MFFLLRLKHKVKLQPSYFGPGLRDQVIAQLIDEFEGKLIEDHLIIAVQTPKEDELPMGKLIHGTGAAEFDIEFTAVVFRAFKGEAVDGFVSQVSKLGFFVEVGPMRVFISKHSIPESYTLVTPIKADETPNQAEHGNEEIKRGDHVRLRILGIRFDFNDGLVGTGEFGDFLG
jgi:DNA-directed RNA polymerase II subunit RPB7